MTGILSYFYKSKTIEDNLKEPNEEPITVAAAESVTAGALTNVLCSEPGASSYFKGSIVAYSIQSKKDLLDIDIKYAEQHNFANPSTTLEMAKQVSKKCKARIGLATTGYSLPMKREENKERGECALDIQNPYAYICLYDSATGYNKIVKVEFLYDETSSKQIQRATVQTKVALEGRTLYLDYIKSLRAVAVQPPSA
jgi:nicotinamide-nucleotide amidase